MIPITLTQLNYILAVAREGHFGRAARSCFVTQPTLSMQIQKLEEDLGVLIFDRTKKPVQPTAIGRKIVEQAQTVAWEVSRIEEIIHSEKEEIKGEFKLGVIPTLAPYLLPLFLEEFITKHPQVDLVIEELQTGQIIDKLKEDAIDAGILVTPLNTRGIVEQVLFYEPFVVYLSPRHPLHKQQRIAENELNLKDIWLLNEGHCFRDQVVDLCRKRKAVKAEHKNLVFESGNLETLKRLVDKKLGYTLLPYLAIQEMRESEQKKKIRRFTDPAPTREVSIVCSRAFHKQAIKDALSSAIVQALPGVLKQPGRKGRIVGLPSFSGQSVTG